jgi:site-specific DNA-methyltransferase (adenine-specific)
MGQTWDGGDVAFRPETWAAVATIMRPGAFLVAFGGTRTYHRLACAVEDGGFVIQDCIMWLFATGFPKRRDMLKPAYEPIVCAYKPGGPRTMQIDECRIEGIKPQVTQGINSNPTSYQITKELRVSGDPQEGRWPANICHDGSDEVVAAFPASAGQQGDVRGTEPSRPFSGTGERVPFKARGDGKRGKDGFWGPSLDGFPCGPTYDDKTGSAARFFFSSKADVHDRWHSRHPTVKPVELMEWLVKLVCPPKGMVLDPFAGSGSTGAAALISHRNAILIEREESYVSDIRERLAAYRGEATRPTPRRATRRDNEQQLGGLLDEC